MRKTWWLSLVLVAGIATSGWAATFTLTSQLTGDQRSGNPDNLIVDVTIAVVDDVASWTIDINSPSHPDVKLDEFYFNLSGVAAADLTFSNFNPQDWAVDDPATVQGLGGAQFMFEALDPAGPPNAADVTNSVSLSFDMTLGTADFTKDNFLLASLACSNEVNGWCGQLGAHLQSLVAGAGQSDSGFALGNYKDDGGGGGGGGNPVPEPGTMLLLGSGLLGLAGAGRKKIKK